jgi:hypothetical protein
MPPKIILLGVLCQAKRLAQGQPEKMRLAVDNHVRHTNYFGATGHDL